MKVELRNCVYAIGTAITATLFLLAPVKAADMPSIPVDAPDDSPELMGSGWYIRGDVGALSTVPIKIGSEYIPANSNFPNSWSIGGGFGYQYNNWIRTDLTFTYGGERHFEGNTQPQRLCQTGYTTTPTAVTQNGTTFNGISIPTYDTCADFTQARMQNSILLLNAYLDLGTWYGITPYVGVGGGISINYQKVNQAWYQVDNGALYDVSFTDPNSGSTYHNNWQWQRSLTTIRGAWALMGGFGYALTPNTTIDIGYRYLNFGNVTSYATSGVPTSVNVRAHELHLGLRYTPD